ncbi:hypothetical protein LTS15_003682 [Exophiala xenobiotica]|nr:hypothetical protein LTS15_003682 [Exophiala xenobiotica]
MHGPADFDIALMMVLAENAEGERSASLERQCIKPPRCRHLQPWRAVAAPHEVVKEIRELNVVPERTRLSSWGTAAGVGRPWFERRTSFCCCTVVDKGACFVVFADIAADAAGLPADSNPSNVWNRIKSFRSNPAQTYPAFSQRLQVGLDSSVNERQWKRQRCFVGPELLRRDTICRRTQEQELTALDPPFQTSMAPFASTRNADHFG